jgi:hypothetical protein
VYTPTNANETSILSFAVPNGLLFGTRNYSIRAGRFMYLLDKNGKERNRLTFPNSSSWHKPIVCNDDVLFCYDISRETGSDAARLVCYDMALTEKWHFDSPGRMGTGADSVLADDVLGRLYFRDGVGQISAFDISRKEIIAARSSRSLNESYYFTSVLPGVGPICHTKGKEYVVMDENLQIISRHKIKGENYRFIPKDGRLFLLTYQGKSKGKESGRICVYEFVR